MSVQMGSIVLVSASISCYGLRLISDDEYSKGKYILLREARCYLRDWNLLPRTLPFANPRELRIRRLSTSVFAFSYLLVRTVLLLDTSTVIADKIITHVYPLSDIQSYQSLTASNLRQHLCQLTTRCIDGSRAEFDSNNYISALSSLKQMH